jgi:hypothetical protein
MEENFTLPDYIPPDFNKCEFINAPLIKTEPAEKDGIAPENYHSTSNYPEYLHVGNKS